MDVLSKLFGASSQKSPPSIEELTLRKKGRIFDAKNLKGRQLRAAIIRKTA